MKGLSWPCNWTLHALAADRSVGAGCLLWRHEGDTSGGNPCLLVHPANDQVYAASGRCTHKGGTLAEGKLAGSQDTCPRHHSVFDVRTGTALKGPYGLLKTGNLPTLEIKVEDGEIWVDLRVPPS